MTAAVKGDRPVVAAFAMPLDGHFGAMRALIRDLAASDCDVVMLTDARFEEEVTALGAQFLDLFGRFPIEAVDPDAGSRTLRHSSYAGHYVDEVVDLVRTLDPDLIVYESYALIGQVVGRLLALPYVAVTTLHEYGPKQALPYYGRDARFQPTPDTERAFARLHARGLTDLTHLSFATSLSPHLNVYPQPPEFLSAEERPQFEPVAFFGSLLRRPEPEPTRQWFPARAATRVYGSIGTYAFDAFTSDCVAIVERLADGLALLEGVEAIISVGSASPTAETLAHLSRPNVRVERWVDQAEVLAEADVFITHHGLSSTHEAIDRLLPMLSFPIFGDQFPQAEHCQRLGIALPLGTRHSLPVDDEIAAVLSRAHEHRAELRKRLVVAREFETEVIAQRPAVIARLRALAGYPA